MDDRKPPEGQALPRFYMDPEPEWAVSYRTVVDRDDCTEICKAIPSRADEVCAALNAADAREKASTV